MLQKIQQFIWKHKLLTIGVVLLLGLLTTGGLVTVLAINHTTPPPQVQNCGQVLTHGAYTVYNKDAIQAENCFWQAYQHCQAATLIYHTMGVDAGATDTLTVEKNGSSCLLYVKAQTYVIPITSKTSTFTCASMTKQEDGLHVAGCDNGATFLIPSAAQP